MFCFLCEVYTGTKFNSEVQSDQTYSDPEAELLKQLKRVVFTAGLCKEPLVEQLIKDMLAVKICTFTFCACASSIVKIPTTCIIYCNGVPHM